MSFATKEPSALVLASLLCLGWALGCTASSREGAPQAQAPETDAFEDRIPQAPGPGDPQEDDDLLTAELSTLGWDSLNNAPVVLLRALGSRQVLPIWIGVAEARAITMALHGIETPRPMTHDLMANLLGHLDAELEEIRITELREGTYYGLLKLRVANSPAPLWVDTRPSDGLALALRTGATIRLARGLFDDLPDYHFLPPDSSDQVVRGLGITAVAATTDLRRELSLPDRSGIVVITVSGEAERRGLKRGDFLVELGGRVPQEPVDLLVAIRETPPGEPLAVTYWRDGEEHQVELRSDDAPAPSMSEKVVA